MNATLPERLAEFIRKEELLLHGDSLMLAVSGGVDSMVMLDLFARLAPEWNFQLTVVHVNHQLRGAESDSDEEFVRQTAARHGIPFVCRRFDTARFAKESHLSKQEAARRLRYQYFSELHEVSDGAKILTAHQANDNAETVLLNALRGAGVRGLSGIPVRRELYIVRPLLFAYRSEIEAYAREHEVAFREDSSNQSLEYRRNLLRTMVFPQLQQGGFPDVIQSLNRLSHTMRLMAERIEREVNEILPTITGSDPFAMLRLDVEGLLQVRVDLRDEVILAILRRLQIEPTADRVKRILGLCSRPSGKHIELNRNLAVYKDRGYILFAQTIEQQPFEVPVRPNETYSFPHFQLELRTSSSVPSAFPNDRHHEFIDADMLGTNLVLRNWRKGDWFVPLGMQSKKKLSDFFTDRKLSPMEKSTTPVLESNGLIVWVCGQRLDDRFKVRSTTRSVMELIYLRRHTSQASQTRHPA